MECTGVRMLTLLIASLGLVVAVPAASEEVSDLREAVRAQGELIEQLQEELEQVRAQQRRGADQVLALQDQLASPRVSASGSGVTAEYVDQRIEAFQTSDESRLFLSGYAKAQYKDELDDGPSTFDVQFNPIFHFRLTERLHFNAELELELEDGGETELELEFATMDYFATDWLTLTAGKFLTPFNVFGPKLHPPWVNKMASRPVIYDKNKGIIGVISDVGVIASGGAPLWSDDSKFNYALFLANGPIAEEEDEPELEFENTPDENNNKTFGGRVGFFPIPNLELGASWMTGRTKGENARFDLLGGDIWYWNDGLELRGEYVRLSRDGPGLDRWGYYVQAAYRLRHHLTDPRGWQGTLGRFEPVLRWGETNGNRPDNREQFGLGLNYWLYESVPLNFTYEFNKGAVKNDRLFFQVAYGF